MKTTRRSLLPVLSLLLVGGVMSLPAAAQFAPNKPIRLIIPASPGGGTDAIGRTLAEALSVHYKQQVVPDNKAGAGGVIGSEMLARSAPDGYSLMIVQTGHTMNPAIFKKLPYDTLKDFTPIISLARSPLILVSGSGTGVKSIKDLMEAGRKDAKTLNFASAEASTRLAIQMISGATGLPATTVSYKGTGPAVLDVAAGHINYTVTTIASTLSQRNTGKLNYVAVLASNRTSVLPDVPSIKEQGLNDIEATGWWGIVAPGNMPRALVQDLHRTIRQVMDTPEMQKRLQTLAAEPWMETPEAFDQYIRKEIMTTQRLAKQAGIEPE